MLLSLWYILDQEQGSQDYEESKYETMILIHDT